MRTIIGLFSILAATFLFNGCANSDYKLLQTDKNTTVAKVEHTDRSIEYRILPQDRLEVMLYKDPDQSTLVALQELGQSMNKKGILVNAKGYITLPLIGRIKVAGLTQSQAAERITARYKTYIKTPSVYLEVLNKRIIVLGEVKKPGVVVLDKEKMTLFEALAFAGDLTDSAVRDNIIILSADARGNIDMRHIDLTHFDTMQYKSLMLRPNDIVYVQPNDWKEFKVASNDYTSIFETVSKIASPFVTLKYLKD